MTTHQIAVDRLVRTARKYLYTNGGCDGVTALNAALNDEAQRWGAEPTRQQRMDAARALELNAELFAGETWPVMSWHDVHCVEGLVTACRVYYWADGREVRI